MDRRSPATRVTEGQLRAAASDPRTPRPDTLQVSLAQECNRIANRIQKVLEDANIKLASVATDALGASGRQMIQAIIGGQQDSAVLAEMSKGLPRNKIPDLKLALEGRVSEHHRFLLKEMLDDLRHVESKMSKVEAQSSVPPACCASREQACHDGRRTRHSRYCLPPSETQGKVHRTRRQLLRRKER